MRQRTATSAGTASARLKGALSVTNNDGTGSVRYRSPSQSRVLRWGEERLLAAEDSWWTGVRPCAPRITADVPRALYVTFIADRTIAARIAPGLFEPLMLPDPSGRARTLFTILLFALERARPAWAPAVCGIVTPTVLHANWRLYGDLIGQAGTGAAADARPGVLFVRSVSRSTLMACFGRRLARCFPFHRAAEVRLAVTDDRVSAVLRAGRGSAPEFRFEGTRAALPASARDLASRLGFHAYHDYARWLIDQHLSLAIWPREAIVQDMHLDFRQTAITPLRSTACHVSGLADLGDLLEDATRPADCFVVEGLRVFLDRVSTLARG
jgi:hypothetical protein